MADGYSHLRESQVPRSLAWSGRGLLRRAAAARIRLRGRAWNRPANDQTDIQWSEEDQCGREWRPDLASSRGRAAAAQAGGLSGSERREADDRWALCRER